MGEIKEKYQPSLAEFYSDAPEVTEIKSQWQIILNADPNPKWIEPHPTVKGAVYIPIDKIEIMLTRYCGRYNVEILREGITPGYGVYITVRLNFVDPETEKPSYQDGCAGWKCETKADLSGAFQAAKSLAIKDAADHLGKCFGRDLNRQTITMQFDKVPEAADKWQELQKLHQELIEQISETENEGIARIIKQKEETSYKKVFNDLTKRKKQHGKN